MQRLIMTIGLPGSGKSTWALEEVKKSNGKVKRINKDSLRLMIDGGVHSKKKEIQIMEARDLLTKYYLEKGHDVIIDDTNFDDKHIFRMQEVIESVTLNGRTVELVMKDFTDVPLSVCIENDLNRRESVGAKVILKMYNKYLKKKTPPPAYNPELPTAIICDIDGTLAHGIDNGIRLPYEWDKVDMDELDVEIAALLHYLNQDVEIILVSGRNSVCREKTEGWLKHHNIHYDNLLMRAEDDNRDDTIIKKEIYEEHIKGKYNVRFVLDDRQRVVDMWRSLGLKCLQVAEGNF